MTSQPSLGRNELIACLCLMNEGKQGRELFTFASPPDEAELNKIADRLGREGISDTDDMMAQIRKLKGARVASGLGEIHPGWILEKLEGESPRVLGILCRFLPGDKVKFLIDHLPSSERKRLPKVNESYRISPPIAEIVRSLVEKKLALSVPRSEGASFSLPHAALMKTDDIRTLFRDLGLEEIRKAFTNVEPRVLKAFLARFSPAMAKEVRGRIDHGRAVTPEAKREAQGHLVSLPMEKLPLEEMLREIGYSALARALSPTDLPWAEMICQKLPPEEGYRLKRVFQDQVAGRPSMILEEKKSEILGRIFILAEKGLIRRYWKGETRKVS